jgi:hypothetical protein
MTFYDFIIYFLMLAAFIIFIVSFAFGDDIRRKFFCAHKWGQLHTVRKFVGDKDVPDSITRSFTCELCGTQIHKEYK